MSIRKYITTAVLTAAVAIGTTACAFTQEDVKEDTVPLESVSGLDVDLMSTDITIKLGSENKVYYKVYESLAPTVAQNGEKLSIRSGKGRNTRMSSDKKDNYIEVTLDKKELGDIDIEASSGDITVDGFDISGKIKTSSGDIEISNIANGKDIAIEASSGKVELEHCNFKTVNKKTSSGDCKFNDVKADRFVLEAESGDTDISGSEISDIESESSSGNVDIDLNGKREDCNFDISVESGGIKINGGRYEDGFTENNNADNTIKIKTTSGDIEINIT